MNCLEEKRKKEILYKMKISFDEARIFKSHIRVFHWYEYGAITVWIASISVLCANFQKGLSSNNLQTTNYSCYDCDFRLCDKKPSYILHKIFLFSSISLKIKLYLQKKEVVNFLKSPQLSRYNAFYEHSIWKHT